MEFSNFINSMSRLYNKILMLVLGIGIFSLFLYAANNPAEFELSSVTGATLLSVWIAFSILSLIYTINGILLNTNFKKSVSKQKKKGKPVEGIRGFGDFSLSLKSARNFSLLITLSSFVSLTIFLFAMIADTSAISTNSSNFRLFLTTLAVIFAFLTISVLFLVDYPEETSFSPGGLIGFYEPNLYPMTLDNLLSDVFTTYLDPATYLDIDEWTMDIANRLVDSFESDETQKTRIERARERVLLLIYLNYSNPDVVSDTILTREIGELVGQENVEPLIEGKETGLTFLEVRKILQRIESMTPDPFRLIDRLMIKLTDDYHSFTNSELYFTVAGKTNQGSVKESSGIIAFFLNNTPREDREVLVEFKGGTFEVHPAHQKIKLRLDPLTDPYPAEQPPIVSEQGEDVISLLTDILQTGDAIWFRFKPNGFGYKVITIQAEEIDGPIMGESMEIKFSKSISFYAKQYLPKISGAAGALLPVLLASIGVYQS